LNIERKKNHKNVDGISRYPDEEADDKYENSTNIFFAEKLHD
jgi:hypothetical protein